MQTIKLLLELTDENKKKFRKMTQEFHPDKKTGSEEIMKKINASKDSDKAVEELYDELILGKTPSSKQKPKQKPRQETRQEPRQEPKQEPKQEPRQEPRQNWHEKVKKRRAKKQEKVRKQHRGRR